MRREERAVEAADADEGDRRAVMQGDGRIATAVRDGCAGDTAGRIGRAVQGHAVAAGLIKGRDRVVTARCRAVVPEGLVAAGKTDQPRAARRPSHRIVRAAPYGRIASSGND